MVGRGEIWLVDLDPTRGHEQAGRRPCLIVSADQFNTSAAELAVVVPLTTRDRRLPWHVALVPPEGGLRQASWAKVEDVRSISSNRLVERWGVARARTVALVGERLRLLLDLP